MPAVGELRRPLEPSHRDGATFDPSTGSWSAIAPAPTPVSGVRQMSVANGRLYLPTADIGRADSPTSFLSYDPVTDSWSTLPTPPGNYLQLVSTGSTVVALDSSDEAAKPATDSWFDPKAGIWHTITDDPLDPSSFRSGTWLGDRLLLTASGIDVIGSGTNAPPITRLASLDASFSRWTVLPDSDVIGGYPTWVAERVVFPLTGSADGGQVNNWGRDYHFGGILDPATGTWAPLPTPPSGRTGLEGELGTVGDRTLVGGQLLQPQTQAWAPLPRPPWGDGRRSATTIATSPDSIFAWGGDDDRANLADGYLLRV